ncbi:MAG: EpsI family protein [Candidatus Eisenbacteria bacterium]|nr:EpsI family protein [Candidatus Eisenbacteria bacterium]
MKRVATVFVLLAATALYVGLHPPVNLAAGHGVLRACPQRFGDWNGTELSFEDAVVEELKADDLLIRRYERADDRVWLCVVYHQNRRYGAHDPQLCYESQGYVVRRPVRHLLDDGTRSGLDVNRFVAERSHDRRLVYYWWTTRGLSTSDRDAFRNRMMVSGVLDNRSWGAFVRVEALVRGGDEAGAARALDDFGSRVARALPPLFASVGAASVRP